MSITNFLASTKTSRPFCGFGCCGNNFGRIERGAHKHGVNRIVKTRRYAKRAERNQIRIDIINQIIDFYEVDDYVEPDDSWYAEYENWLRQEEYLRDECYENEYYWDYDEKYDPEWCAYNDSLELTINDDDVVEYHPLNTGGPRNSRQNGVTE